MEEYESVALVKPEVFVYQLPPRPSTTRAMRAADWNLANPDWRGRLKVVSKSGNCKIKLEERNGDLFAACPVDTFPGLAVEPVSDSSRYFVLRLQDPSGKHAFVGLGFQDRGDAFDFNVALQEHFKLIKRDKQLAEEDHLPATHVDYSLKQGEKITVRLGDKLGLKGDDLQKTDAASKAPGATGGLPSTGTFLPPPPAAGRPVKGQSSPSSQQQPSSSDWGEFLSAGDSNKAPPSSGSSWVQF